MSSAQFSNYAFPPTLPPPISLPSRKNSFAGLSLSTPTSPSFTSNSKIFHALPPASNNIRRRSSNPVVYARKKSRVAFALLTVLLVLGFFLFRREVGGGARGDHESVVSGAFLKDRTGERAVKARLQEMRQTMMEELKGSPRRSPSSNNIATTAHKVTSAHEPHELAADQPPLTAQQELAALLLFLSSSSTNVLPPTIDPSLPLDPDYVLSHQLPASLTAREAALRSLLEEATSSWPVVLVGREKDPWTKAARDLLVGERYFGKKQQGLGVVYVDRRPDILVLTPLLARLTAFDTLPTILIGGVPVGDYAALKALHDSNQLAGLLQHAGADIGKDAEERKIKERRAALERRKQGK